MTLLVFIGSLLLAMALGVPIAYALLVSGIALMLQLDTFDAQILAQNLVEGANSFPLLAVPFFMLAGEIMNVGGLSKRIVVFASALVGHVRGGLGYVAILAAVIAALCIFCSVFAPWVSPYNPFDLAALNLADARARQYLARQMEAHFFGGGADAAQGYVPPSA